MPSAKLCSAAWAARLRTVSSARSWSARCAAAPAYGYAVMCASSVAKCSSSRRIISVRPRDKVAWSCEQRLPETVHLGDQLLVLRVDRLHAGHVLRRPCEARADTLADAYAVREGIAVAAAMLGLVHRAIGAGEQLVRIGPVVGKDRATDAAGKARSVHGERRGDGLYDPLGGQPRLLATTVATQQHDELVPAEACHGINRAGGSLEPPCRLAQHEVAGRMAMDVIDWLETVEIYEQNREGSGVAARGGNGLLDTIVQERPVGESS